MLISFIVVIIILLLLFFKAYIKVTSRFWSSQPVFHWYNIHYYLLEHQHIEKDVPPIDSYVNLYNISTKKLPDESASVFLRKHSNRVIPPDTGENHSSFLSSYCRQDALYGVITTRSLYISFKNKSELPIYYVDNLCVHSDMRKRGIAYQLIRTHYYQMRRLCPEIQTYLFKRKNYNSNFLIPLLIYQCTKQTLAETPTSYFPHGSQTLIEINKHKLALFINLVRREKQRFECVVLPDLACVSQRMENNWWQIYGILESNELRAAYVFQNDVLIATIDSYKYADVFQIGFEQSCRRIGRDVTIHFIGDTLRLRVPLQNIESETESLYLYNYITRCNDPKDCLLMI